MEVAEYSRFLLSLIGVIGLIWLFSYGAKRTGLDKRLRGVTGSQGRLAVVDVLYLDRARKLMLVRADSREYLLLIAGERAEIIDKLEANNGKAND